MTSIFRRGNTVLKKYMTQRGRSDLVDYVPHGYRDIIWCPIINEPVVITYENNVLKCLLCEMTADEDGSFAEPHPFIISVIGPYHSI